MEYYTREVMTQNTLQMNLSLLVDPLGLKNGDIVYLTVSYWPFYLVHRCSVLEFCNTVTSVIFDKIGESGTIVVSTHSLNLCNTNIIFDIEHTKSFHRGEYAEYLRKLPNSVRSFHPFASYCAIGGNAERLMNNVSRFAYGPETPEDRLILMGAKKVGLGVDETVTTSIHHLEQNFNVPYRYVKEFIHPVQRNAISYEPFYLHVLYKKMNITSSKNTKIFSLIKDRLSINRSSFERINCYCYSLKQFYELCSYEFLKNPFVWAENEPEDKPYRN